MRRVSVTGVTGGWAVTAIGLTESQMFLSGWKAKKAAGLLARKIAATGRDTEVRIISKAGLVLDHWVCRGGQPAKADARPLAELAGA
jgi:hypothetical protein